MTMNTENCDSLADLIESKQSELLHSWRRQVRELPSARDLDAPTLNDHIPLLLIELADALRSHSSAGIPAALATGSPPVHGGQRMQDGFDIREVVAEYNILRGCIHNLAQTNGLRLEGKPFHIFNDVMDGAIGLAVENFATRQALEVQNRREEYLAFVTHDLRTPLGAIALSAKVIDRTLQKEGTTPEMRQVLNALHRNVQHLATLVRTIMDENSNLQTEVGQKLHRRTFDLWPFVQALVQDLYPAAGTDSTRLVNRVPDDLEIYADASLLTRVFQNLIANAIKYTPKGEIVIGAAATGDDGSVECWVTDNGAGIPESLRGKVFEKGESDPQQDGLGLGLAIVRTFTESHGGGATVESNDGPGTTFRFTLPGPATRSTR